MDSSLISRTELAKRWGCKPEAVAKKEAAGCLKRCPDVPGVVYKMKDVLLCEGIDEYDPMSPLERKKLLAEIRERDEMIETLKEKIREAAAAFFNLNMEVTKNEISK